MEKKPSRAAENRSILHPAKETAVHFADARIKSTVPDVAVEVWYPHNLGNPLFDALAASIAKARWKESARALYDLIEYPLPEGKQRSAGTRYNVTASSPRYFTVLFETAVDLGSARNSWEYTTVSFDRQSGSQLNRQDIFPDTTRYIEKILPALMPRIVQAFREQRFVKPDEECAIDRGASLAMSKIALTQEGLDLFYSSGEERGCGYTPVRVSLAKKELVDLGVPAKFWAAEHKRKQKR